MLAAAANAGSAYLPVTGPTPLRFEIAMTRVFDFASVGKILVLPLRPESVETNIVSPVVTVTESNTSPATITISTTSGGDEAPAPEPPVAPHPADNLLVITPQMLAEYFKPFPGATNAGGVSVFLPVQVGFTPPTDKAPVASRATYKVQ